MSQALAPAAGLRARRAYDPQEQRAGRMRLGDVLLRHVPAVPAPGPGKTPHGSVERSQAPVRG